MTEVESADLLTALTRLDQDIAETERRLTELRAMRESIQPFLERYGSLSGDGSLSVKVSLSGSGHVSSLTDQVVQVFQQRPDDVLDVDDVIDVLRLNGIDAKREAVRNAIHYAARMGRVHKERRGRFTLKDTSTPGVSGVDVNGESDSDDSRWKEGGGRLGSAVLRDQDDGADNPQVSLGRDGDRAPIGG